MQRIVVVLILHLTIFFFGKCYSINRIEEEELKTNTQRIALELEKKLRFSKDLEFICTQLNINNDIQSIFCIFQFHSPATINIARLLVSEISGYLIASVNLDEKIRSLLHSSILTEKNFALYISFVDRNDKFFGANSLEYVLLMSGVVQYSNFNVLKGKSEVILTETYIEALKKTAIIN